MFKPLLIINFLLLTIYGCAHKGGNQSGGIDKNNSEFPTWVTDLSGNCKKRELCAIGEGPGYLMASANGRKAIAQIFETKIYSKFTATETMDNTEVSEDILSEVEEITEGVLSGVEIKKVYEGKESVFVLAVMDKRKAAKGFRREIKRIDSDIKALSKDGNIKALNKIIKLFEKRSPLNSRYEFLVGGGIKPPVKREIVLQKRKDKIGKVILSVDIKESNKNELTPLIESVMSDMGFNVSNKLKSTNSILGSLTSEKLHLKVKGFMKYKFILNLYSTDKHGDKLGSLQFATITVGINASQVYQKALVQIKEYINENISDLNFK